MSSHLELVWSLWIQRRHMIDSQGAGKLVLDLYAMDLPLSSRMTLLRHKRSVT